MNNRERTNVANDLRYISKLAVEPTQQLVEDGIKGRTVITVSGSEHSWMLVDDAAIRYKQLLTRILTQNSEWRQKFTDEEIVDRLSGLLGVVCDEKAKPQRIGILLEELSASFDTEAVEQVVYVPLGGFAIEDSYTLRIGNVTLMFMSEARMNVVLQGAKTMLDSTMDSNEEKEKALRIYQSWLASIVLHACAEYRVIASADKAREMAEREAHVVLELLRVAIPHEYGWRQRVEIGFLWEINRTAQVTPILSADTKHFTIHTARKGPMKPFQLDEYAEITLKELGLFEVARILEEDEDQRTNFERQLLRAIHWFSDAQHQREVEKVVTSLVTCWEALFTHPNQDEPIMKWVSAGVAATAGTRLEERNYLRQRARQLYTIRSDISHGRFAHLSENDRADLLTIAHRVLLHVIPRFREFSSKDALLAWVQTQEGTGLVETEQ